MDFIQIVRDIGIPAALLMAVLIGAWRAAQWIASEVIRPTVSRMCAFLDKLEAAVDHIAGTMERVVHQQAEMVRHVEQISTVGCAHRKGG